jgi:hypothetical protein
LDVLAKQQGWRLHPQQRLHKLMAALVNGERWDWWLDGLHCAVVLITAGEGILETG